MTSSQLKLTASTSVGGQLERVGVLRWERDGGLVLGGSLDKAAEFTGLFVWSPNSGQPARSLARHPGSVASLSLRQEALFVSGARCGDTPATTAVYAWPQMNLVWQREGRVIGRTGNKVALLRHDGSWSWFRESDGEHLQDEVRLPLPNRWDPFLPRPQLSPDLKLAIAFDGEQRFAIVDLRAGTTSWFDAPFPVVKVLTSDRHIVLTGHETVIAVTGWDGATRRQISLDQQITPEVGRWLSDTLLFVARAGGLPVAADVDSGECFEFSGPTSIDDDVDPWVTRGVPHMSRATPKTVWLAHYNERVDGFDWHNRRHVAWAIAPEPVTGLGVHSDAIVCGTIGGSVHCYAPDHA